MNPIINKALNKSISYQEYKNLVSKLVTEKSTTGNEKTEDLANYTMLNERRMKRWDKTVKISENQTQKIKSFTEKATWLVITESWCGDAAHVLPVMNKVAEHNPNINLKIVMRDENEALMDMFLTNGSRSIPKLIMLDNSGDVMETYGPRPTEATKMVQEFKAKYGKLTPELKEDLQHWYNKNKGQNVVEDLTQMLCKLQPSLCQ